ncbi:Rz1-like lysis system protein LysC [Klebsiella quasipneumoniae]|uniref:Rz1-like lysis system protein LysC n=1 Tax=Klebsiella quasipneumoniae TaxID=1463165 RepID=UPI00352B66BB
MLCAGCSSAPPVPMPPPVIVYNACPMPGSEPLTNGDLSADIRQLENALKSCAIQVDTVKQCQDEIDAKAQQSAKSLN